MSLTDREIEELLKTDNTTPKFSLEGDEYPCHVVNVYDGDTVKCVFKFNNVYTKFNCRLTGIDTPEMKPPLSNPDRDLEKEAAKRAKARLLELVSKKVITIKCGKFDKYGRLLCNLFDKDTNLNDILIREGHAKPYDGGTKTKWTF